MHDVKHLFEMAGSSATSCWTQIIGISPQLGRDLWAHNASVTKRPLPTWLALIWIRRLAFPVSRALYSYTICITLNILRRNRIALMSPISWFDVFFNYGEENLVKQLWFVFKFFVMTISTKGSVEKCQVKFIYQKSYKLRQNMPLQTKWIMM